MDMLINLFILVLGWAIGVLMADAFITIVERRPLGRTLWPATLASVAGVALNALAPWQHGWVFFAAFYVLLIAIAVLRRNLLRPRIAT